MGSTPIGTTMKVYRLEILVIDYDKIGETAIREAIENANYPNDCIAPKIKKVDSRDIGEWSDDHPLNLRSSQDQEYKRLFDSA